MGLNIYRHKSEIPDGMDYVQVNDIFFDARTKLLDNNFTRKVLLDIDKAEYSSEQYFKGRLKGFGDLHKDCLSTGTKTLLNISQYPDKCFDVCECGVNALRLLAYIGNGNIVWELPVLSRFPDTFQDIVFSGRHFTCLKDVSDFVGGDNYEGVVVIR